MPSVRSTLDVDYFQSPVREHAVPGALLVFTADAPKCGPVPLDGSALVLGRGAPPSLSLEDLALSRRHARVSFDGERFVVEDLGSRNGLVLDGAPLAPNDKAPPGGRVLRLGRTVFVLLPDLRPYLPRPLVVEGGEVIGPMLARAFDEVDDAARTSDVLHLTAESGAGKELAARRFHQQGPRASGPFVAVNCAAIPHGVAERLLFGARKGAYSGASESAQGYFQAADGGTLFLDEIGELEAEVQAKLLRALETREVLALGASKPQPVDVRVVSATHRDLRGEVTAGRFREDLFYRLCRPSVRLPPLRERPEEIAFHALAAARAVDPAFTLGPAFLEACLLREWPGNVRELLQEAEQAARRAHRKGLTVLEPELLDDEAGRRRTGGASDTSPDEGTRAPKRLPPDDVIEAALRESGGAVATAARALGVHRNQLRRWLAARGERDEG